MKRNLTKIHTYSYPVQYSSVQAGKPQSDYAKRFVKIESAVSQILYGSRPARARRARRSTPPPARHPAPGSSDVAWLCVCAFVGRDACDVCPCDPCVRVSRVSLLCIPAPPGVFLPVVGKGRGGNRQGPRRQRPWQGLCQSARCAMWPPLKP